MTRKEEIEKEAVFRYPEMTSNFIAFIKGANWADKTMLDRACKWLENRHNIAKYLNIITSRTEDLAKAFRRAMEGE